MRVRRTNIDRDEDKKREIRRRLGTILAKLDSLENNCWNYLFTGHYTDLVKVKQELNRIKEEY